MEKTNISTEDLHDIATGAAFLGTGGGGDPYIGRLLALSAIETFGMPKVVDAESIDVDSQRESGVRR